MLKIILIAAAVVILVFLLLFVIYFFNLDMKATALLAPLLEKWYDNLPRKQYI